MEAAAGRCVEILEECVLLYLAGDERCCPSKATYDLVREIVGMATKSDGDGGGSGDWTTTMRVVDALDRRVRDHRDRGKDRRGGGKKEKRRPRR